MCLVLDGDAGKPFVVMQKAGVETAIMNLNIRARDKTLRAAQHAAQGGNIAEALKGRAPPERDRSIAKPFEMGL